MVYLLEVEVKVFYLFLGEFLDLDSFLDCWCNFIGVFIVDEFKFIIFVDGFFVNVNDLF